MKRIIYIACFVSAAMGIAQLTANTSLAQSNGTQTVDGRLDAAGLKNAITGLGYELKDIGTGPGKEKYQFVIEKGDLSIPVGAELSTSKNYVWLTVNLGEEPGNLNYKELLKRNAKIQPSFFYITANNSLMVAEPIDNRLITAVVMRRVIDKLTADVVDTKDLWQTKK